MIKEIGKEAAFKKINSDWDFRWIKGYVFVIEDEKATILAHPVFSQIVGREDINLKDDDGKLFCQEMIRIAKTKGKGWITCNRRRLKNDCYVLKVPDENMIVVSVLKLGSQE